MLVILCFVPVRSTNNAGVNQLLPAVKKLVQFHWTKFRIDQMLIELKLLSLISFSASWVEEPDYMFCSERRLVLLCPDMLYDVTVAVNDVSVICRKFQDPGADSMTVSLPQHPLHFLEVELFQNFITRLLAS